MSTTTSSSDSTLSNALPHPIKHQLFQGTTWHSRLLPSVNKFVYPYRYWGVNISALATGQALPEVATPPFSNSKWFRKKLLEKGLPLFSAHHKALQQFCAHDYLIGAQDADKVERNDVEALEQRLRHAFIKHTGSAPLGDMIGMMVCRNADIYFSPVNFYLGVDSDNVPTHILAEVSNTPWDKRHYYGFLLTGSDTEFCHDKNFHVSPFNPIDQQYCWQVSIKNQPDNCLKVRIAINISDARGEILKTGIKMTGVPMNNDTIRNSLRKNPLMNITSLTRIYWHAFKLYTIKKVPYIDYDEKLADSQQQK